MTNYQTTESYAYHIGFNAASLGKLKSCNPYLNGTSCYAAFNHGHQDGSQKLNIERIELTKKAQSCPKLDTFNIRAN